MSGPAIAFVLGALSAKTAVDGLAKGNIAQAVIGGVGAYFAFSGLPGGEMTAGQTAETKAYSELGTEAGKATANNVAKAAIVGDSVPPVAGPGTNLAADASGSPMFNLNEAAGAPKDPISVSDLALTNAPKAPAIVPGANTPATGGGTEFLSKIDKWTTDHPLLAYGAMQTGGQMLAGYAQGQQQQDLLAQQQKLLDEARYRRGLTANTGFLSGYKYVPSKGTWEAKNG